MNHFINESKQTHNDQVILSEAFLNRSAALFHKMKPVFKDGSLILYSNDYVVKDYIKLMNDTTVVSNDIKKSILKAINKNIVVPCYASSGVIDRLKTKFKPKKYHIHGLYDSQENKIYIVTDDKTTFMLLTNTNIDGEAIRITLHELMHYFSNVYKEQFYKITFKLVNEFYKNFLAEFFKCNKNSITINDTKEITKMLFEFFEWNRDFSKSEFLKCQQRYSNLLDKYIIPKSTQQNRVAELKAALMEIFYFVSWNKIFKQPMKYDYLLHYFMSCLYITYKNMGYNNLEKYTTFYQEIIFPSEIISMMSSTKLNDEHRQLLNLI